MGWFGRKRESDVRNDVTLAKDNLIEVVAHKTANKEVVEQAKKSTQELNKLLVKNGFTIKIFLAAGGQEPIEGGNK